MESLRNSEQLRGAQQAPKYYLKTEGPFTQIKLMSHRKYLLWQDQELEAPALTGRLKVSISKKNSIVHTTLEFTTFTYVYTF